MADLSIGICNQALSQLGATLINSFTEQTVESIHCNAIYDQVRREVLRTHPWNFAIKRIELAQDQETPSFGFQYQYTLPSDLVRLLRVERDSSFKNERKKILTNSPTCFIKYTFDNTDISEWDDSFKALIIARLRSLLAYTLTKDTSQAQLSLEIYKQLLRESKGIDGSEDPMDDLGQEPSALIAVRFS